MNAVWPPEADQNILYLSPYHRPVLNSATFCKNIKKNSAKAGKFRVSAKNSVFRGKVWSLSVSSSNSETDNGEKWKGKQKRHEY